MADKLSLVERAVAAAAKRAGAPVVLDASQSPETAMDALMESLAKSPVDTSNISSVPKNTTTPKEETEEKRSVGRVRLRKRALIVYRAGQCSMNCTIVDRSDNGAMIQPADILFCPEEFSLKPEVGTARDCEVVWRKNTVLGVRFI